MVFFIRFLRMCFSWVGLVLIVMYFRVVFSCMYCLLNLGLSCWMRFFIKGIRLISLGLDVLFLVFILLIRSILFISLIIWFDLVAILFSICLISGFFVCFMFCSILRLVVKMAMGVWNWWLAIDINFVLSWFRVFCFCCVLCCLWIFL